MTSISRNWIPLCFILVISAFVIVPFVVTKKIQKHTPIVVIDSTQIKRKLYTEREDSIRKANVERGIEKTLEKMKYNGGYLNRMVIYTGGLFNDAADADMGFYQMLTFGFIKQRDSGMTYNLTEKGYSFKGFNKQNTVENLQIKKLELDVQNSKNMADTYWVTFGLAIASFCFSAFLLVLKIKEPKEPKN